MDPKGNTRRSNAPRKKMIVIMPVFSNLLDFLIFIPPLWNVVMDELIRSPFFKPEYRKFALCVSM